ncbi:receptor-like protein 6 [Castanea sativa]|uniref:receptor-like protein 6 n=1 Tax=Castanea sativa TaxID=21020 RepID=UPI003F64F515
MHPLCHAAERSALLQFKESFIINNSTCRFVRHYLPPVASWTLENSSCCSWDGVYCDKKSGHVIGLELINNCLYGSINSSSSLFQLVHLQLLDLSYNNFNFSQIPSSIGSLSKLQYLRLSNSFFAGQIPSEISQLSKLSSLDLSCNSHPSTCFLLGSLSFDPSSKRLLELKRPHFESLVQNLTNLEELVLPLVNIPYPVPNLLANMSSLSYLMLTSCGLLGELPTNIFQLPNAEFLHLVQNPGLTGNFPDFNRTSHLKYLFVMGTGMSGEIPASIGNLDSLEYLALSLNNFSGLVPPSIGNLSKLTVMALAGPIPSSISRLKNLMNLDLSFNNLSGTMELDSLHVLKNLTTLGLSFNKLSLLGKINSSASFPNLTMLSLASCNLSEFPQYLQNLDKLIYLDLSFNNIRGLVPQWFLETSKETLLILDLSHNFLTGFDQSPLVLPWYTLEILKIDSNRIQGSLPVPPLSTVSYIISNNSLTGEIPPLICNQTLLQVLDLSKNNLSGQIPECMGSLSNSLSILNLGSNNFHGTIPRTWTLGCKLRMINLGHNKLKGLIPRSMSKCAMLEILDLGHNQINDTFPFWLGTLPELKILILRYNKFHGAIESPYFKSTFPKLRIIDLSYNGLVGNLPSEYFNSCSSMKIIDEEQLAYLQADISFDMGLTEKLPDFLSFPMMAREYYDYSIIVKNKGLRTEYAKIIAVFALLDFSGNKFEGEVPESIGTLKGLIALDLSNNLLSGHIPSAMGNLTQLESLDLSLNKLSGVIPQQLAQLNFLSFFNVSYNNFTGPIPRGNQFDTFLNNSFEGNSGLCGNQLSRKCEGPKAFLPPLSASTDNQELGSSMEFDWEIVVIGYGSGFIIGVVIGHIVITRKHDWFLKNFGIRQPKASKGKKK